MQKPNGSFVKKVFAAGLAVSTALWGVAAFSVLPAFAVDIHPAGTLVVSAGTVYKISDDGTTLQGIDSLAKFYSNRFSFATVVAANSADLALPSGGLLPYGSGALFNDGGTVYQLSGGTKHGFTSAAVFTGLGYEFDDVVAAGSLASVPAGANIDNTTGAHLEGTFVVSGGTVWMITATGRKGISLPGILFSYGATFDNVVPANAADLALANEGNATFRTGSLVNDSGTVYAVTSTTKYGFPSASCFTGFGFSFSNLVSGSTSGLTAGTVLCGGSTVTPPAGTGTLSVSLASDTPAASTVVYNAARVGMTKVNFTATGGDATITNMMVKRTGFSIDADVSSIIVLDVSNGVSVGSANQIGLEKTLNSDHKVAFNDSITVTNGTTKTLMFAVNMPSSGAGAGDQLSLTLESVTYGSGTVLTPNLAGNLMTVNTSVTIGTVTVAAGASNPSALTQAVGTTSYILTSIKITANATEDLSVSHIRFYNNGTSADTDVANLKLTSNAVTLGTATKLTDKAVTFDFATPVVIAKGNNQEFILSGDIVGGSARTISLDIDKQTDVVVKGNTFGFYILPTFSPAVTNPYFNAADTTIGNGTITFSKANVTSLNVSAGSTNQALGAFKSTVTGESIQVTRLAFKLTYTGGTGETTATTTNIVIKDSTGKAVAGPFSATTYTTYIGATTTDTVIFPVGTNTYTIYGDISSLTAAGATVKFTLPDASDTVTARGVTTNQTITPGPTSDLALDTVTVRAAALSVSTSSTPAAQSVIVGAQQFTFANFVLDATASGEDVRVTQLGVASKTGTAAQQNVVANLTLYNGTTALQPIVQPTVVAGETRATSTFSLTSPITITKGSTVTLTLKGDLILSGTSIAYGLNGSTSVSAVGASTGTTVTPSVTNSEGQVMTISTSGTLTVAADSSEPTNGQLITGNTSAVTLGTLLFTASQEDVNLDIVHFDVSGAKSGTLTSQTSMVYLYDGATQIASMAPTSTTGFTFTNLNGKFTVPKGSVGKKLTVKVDTAAVTNHAADGNTGLSGGALTLSMPAGAFSGIGVSSGTTLATASLSGSFTGQQYSLYKSVPTYAVVALPTGTLTDGTAVLYKFKVTADSKGDIGFYSASFAMSTTTATVTAFQLYEEPNTTNEVNLTNDAVRTFNKTFVQATDGKGGTNVMNLLFDTGTDGVASGGEYRVIAAGTSKTYELRGTVANSATGSSVRTTMLGDSAFVTTYPAAATTQTAGDNDSTNGISSQEQGKFVWSDLAYGNNTSTATNTAEWTNGYRVSGLTTTTTQAQLSR